MLFALQIHNVITASIGQEVNRASASLNFERRELWVVSLALALALLAS